MKLKQQKLKLKDLRRLCKRSSIWNSTVEIGTDQQGWGWKVLDDCVAEQCMEVNCSNRNWKVWSTVRAEQYLKGSRRYRGYTTEAETERIRTILWTEQYLKLNSGNRNWTVEAENEAKTERFWQLRKLGKIRTEQQRLEMKGLKTW